MTRTRFEDPVKLDGISSLELFPMELASLRPELLRFATKELNNSHEAEEMVHRALLSALEGLDSFNGKSSLKTWVFSILKNKLKDFFRSTKRWRLVDIESEADEFELLSNELFDDDGNWRTDIEIADWGDPESLMINKQFVEVLESCMDRLPLQTSTVFRRREVWGLTVAEICEESDLTEGCVNMTLSRARSKLRSCLQLKWFGGSEVRS